MAQEHNAKNERIKHRYFEYLSEARGYGPASVDAAAMALARFEEFTRHRDFAKFRHEQAVAFKRKLSEQKARQSQHTLSKSTLRATLMALKRFFEWLSAEPEYRAKIRHSDASYFRLTERDSRVAQARRFRPVPTVDQVRKVILAMPVGTDIERRDQAVIAFALLTGARDGAIVTMRLRNVDLAGQCVNQDPRDVHTKFGSAFVTYFMPVGDDVVAIVRSWIERLGELGWAPDDALFPATNVELGEKNDFAPNGLKRVGWKSTSPIRRIFRAAFACAALPYCNPHSLRKTLVQLGQRQCRTPEEFKAWSQNIGHRDVLTTFMSYGEVPAHRQGEILQKLREPDL